MQTATIFYIILAGIIALSLALLQYKYKSKASGRRSQLLALLRFLTLFAVGLLIINPKFESVTYFDEKPNLILAIDNSESISYLKQNENASRILNQLKNDDNLKEQFTIETYSFGSDFNTFETLTFEDKQTNINRVFKNIEDIYSENTAPIILISDGNQTYGADYQFYGSKSKQAVFPVVLGDTIQYSDLRIERLNVNRFAYLKNRFPVEIFVNYTGDESVNSQLRILSGNATVFSQNLNFDSNSGSQLINTTLPANSVGVKSYTVEIVPLESERNKVNNRKRFAVEVIDQKNNVAIVAEGPHPDLGAFKKAIESNEQRRATILKPRDYISKKDDFQLVILYQPNNSFSTVLKSISDDKRNVFFVAGPATSWDLLNKNQEFFSQTITNQSEDYQPSLNLNYNTFIIDNLNFDNYPPLKSEFGKLEFKVPEQTILFKTINGTATSRPLLSSFEFNNNKYALLNGEGIWRWRAQNYLDTNSFQDFDNFMGKLVQYLSSNQKRRRMNVDYRSFYNGNESLIISAQFFNKSYEFDADANLVIRLKNETDDTRREIPLLLDNSSYSIDLSGIAPGDYSFTVLNTNEPISASGQFKVLEYNVEQQFLNADISKLKAVAEGSGGKTYFSNQVEQLVNDLQNDSRFAIVQRSSKDIVPLIDWKYLLAFLALTLSLEWFIRKYNGLI
ncbi:VWA domain-containing protein [Winogradskyella maritima]|uniref:VWA domain-containing protein n=1 Tax=Winogradskyella maritima TaxID=1517766 RepID=A0ABV8AME3_9FLAO|nr:VWA domain-containing protein [Winogradskyella maritima]